MEKQYTINNKKYKLFEGCFYKITDSVKQLTQDEFLYTLYSPPASLIAFRRTARSVTLSPRYSVNTTASELWNFSRTSATIATFSAFDSPIGDPFLVKNKVERCHSANAPVSQIVYLVRQRFLFLNHLL